MGLRRRWYGSVSGVAGCRWEVVGKGAVLWKCGRVGECRRDDSRGCVETLWVWRLVLRESAESHSTASSRSSKPRRRRASIHQVHRHRCVLTISTRRSSRPISGVCRADAVRIVVDVE